jgi:hypothetical protein
VLRQAEVLAARVGDPYVRGWVRGVGGVTAALEGRWRDGFEGCSGAEEIFRQQCGGIAWELSTFQFFLIYSLAFTGRIKELCLRVPRSLREAEERGDLYGAAAHRTALATLVWLAADDIAQARAKVQEAMRHWSRGGFQVEHFWEMLANGQTDLYAGDAEGAYARVAAAWKPLASSLLLRVQLSRIEALHLRGRVALAAARLPAADRAALVASARRDARRCIREDMAWSTPLGQLLEAGAAAVEGERDRAMTALEHAIAGLEAADMALYAAAARRQLGRLRGGEGGATLVSAVDAWMRGQSIVRPERMAAMLAPGFDE